MSKTFIVDGNSYTFPEQSANPSWGEEVTSWAEAVTNTLSGLSASGDILARTATIANDQSSATAVSGLSFDSSVVRGATILYSIYRTSSSISTPKAETGILMVDYDGSTWSITRESTQDTGVTFTVDAGVIKYTSTDVGSTSYSGTMSYRAFANTQS